MTVMLETQTAEAKRLKAQVARLQSPQRIMHLVEMMDLGLRPPRARPHLARRYIVSTERLED